MQRTANGEWLTTNQILMTTEIENKHIIRAVNRRSETVREQQLEKNNNEQAEEDRIVIDQQQDESWAHDVGRHHFTKMSEEAHPIFTGVNFKTTIESEK